MKKLAGVVFRPGGFGPWLRERADLFYEESQSLSDLWPVEPMRERLRDLAPEVALRVLDETLCEQASGRERRSHVVQALRLLRSLSVRETARALSISERRLHTVFSEDVGLSPKQWSRVRRFQRALRALHQGGEMRWAELAVSCGYADQSHFSRDFRSFSGIDPTTYSAARGLWQNHVTPLRRVPISSRRRAGAVAASEHDKLRERLQINRNPRHALSRLPRGDRMAL